MRLPNLNRKIGLLFLGSLVILSLLFVVSEGGPELEVLRGQTPVEVSDGKYYDSITYRVPGELRDMRLRLKSELGLARSHDRHSSEWRRGNARIILREGISLTSEELSARLPERPRSEEEFQEWFAEQSKGWVTIEVITEPDPMTRMFNRFRNQLGF